ncbi:ABC-type uncharacterized transport systems, ATPase components [Gloeomargarita lithophora Alchichica-D10]|uniref:ABC-type uncharacterized transport systems, ATPase components n=1 Tax=Gloeomargarita lithophora Alchichica-D10 TaxID=1188229 RepID=A0A1J0A9J7_9CYAN|nr:PglZ domain-containing protein [Gloeomargarita lithophora]APB32589.1 ABC-type uncharacterized transport systems, ATPase components [Gloeomargarita lithophora Alchichica-D10]
MGIVSEHLSQLVAKQIHAKGIVVWYDREKHYEKLVSELTIPDTTIARYTDSFFALRRDVAHLLQGHTPPQLLVYVPLARENTDNALIELDCLGVIMRPGDGSLSCNTRLSVVARHAFKSILSSEEIGKIVQQIDAGKLDLLDLDAIGSKGKDISAGMIALILGTTEPITVTLLFLNDQAYDGQIIQKSVTSDLQHLFNQAFGIELATHLSLEEWRYQLVKYLLITELAEVLKDKLPPQLCLLTTATECQHIENCLNLVNTWRNHQQYNQNYALLANKIEQELRLVTLNLPVELLSNCETFRTIVYRILQHIQEQALHQVSIGFTELTELLSFAQQNSHKFWSRIEPTIHSQWLLVITAMQVLIESQKISTQLKNSPQDMAGLVNAYTSGEQPWCVLDTYYRHLESCKYDFDFPQYAQDHQNSLDKLIISAEQTYTQVISEMAKLFTEQFATSRHGNLLQQRQIFSKYVAPYIEDQKNGKVAYIWVDALCYEMALDMKQALAQEFTAELVPAIATPPTITETGMAALLPKADQSFRIVSTNKSKLAVEICGTVIHKRQGRINFLKANVGVNLCDMELEQLLPKPNKALRERIGSADLILITSQEIDKSGEQDNPLSARRQIDRTIKDLCRAVRILTETGIKTIIITSDHGHLFADQISDDLKIDPPCEQTSTQTTDLHRRVWIGTGGEKSSAYLYTSLNKLGVDSEYDLATPYRFAVFKAKGGANCYFHGGLSPQEVIIPVLVLKSDNRQVIPSEVDWQVTPGSQQITTRFFSVKISGARSGLGLGDLPKIRMELRANKKIISQTVMATYGFTDATGEIVLKTSANEPMQVEPNTIALMIIDETNTNNNATLYLLDARTNRELVKPITIPICISL